MAGAEVMATPYDAPIPGAPGYATAALNATTAYQNALARINSKRTDTLRQYGYLGDVDPKSGVLSNIRVDPYNQYGGLQQMLRSNADEVQQAEFSAEERGLHGGLAHKGITDAHYDLGNASQQLGTAFTGALGGYQDEQNQAAYSRDSALYQGELDAARLAIENGQHNPATPDKRKKGGGRGQDTTTDPSVFVQRLIDAGLSQQQASGLDPALGAAILAAAAKKNKTTITPYGGKPNTAA